MNTNTELNYTGKYNFKQYTRRDGRYAVVRLSLALVVGLLLSVPCAQAETKLSTKDQDFILAAAQGGMTEVKLGELAMRNGVTDDVKSFGQLMVKDHTAINEELKALAALKGVMLPTSLDSKHQEVVDKMATLTGFKFDDAYISNMKKDHKMDLEEFKDESEQTNDMEIKNFLEKSIPIVEAHLNRISAVKKEGS
jgi:putative membrane protein